MDIHPPEGPTRSLRDFGIHILVVTIGILIALSLEGLRETIHEHTLVVETRESFVRELTLDREHLQLDRANVSDVKARLNQVLAEMPRLMKSPTLLRTRVEDLRLSNYFFSDNSWQSALTSGALPLMRKEELDRFEGAYSDLHNYQEAQKRALPQMIAAKAYFESRTQYSQDAAANGEEKLRELQAELEGLEHLGKEFTGGLDDVFAAR